MISADWSWWTYFLIDGTCVSSGRIQSYDLTTQSLTYLRRNGNDPKRNPHSLGTSEFGEWCWDTVDGKYDEIWVDPAKSHILSREDYDMIEIGQRPPSFVRLGKSADPKAYFDGESEFVSGNPKMMEILNRHNGG